MFDEPDEAPQDRVVDPAQRAKDKADEFRIHAEICAVFEGPRKFDAQIVRAGDSLLRDIQKRMAKLEKAKDPTVPLLPPEAEADVRELLAMPKSAGISTNDYHINRRPGEVMIARWLEGEQVESFYERIQAHFDVAMEDYREEQRQAHGWKQDAKTLAYIAALDALDVKMPERYLREVISKHRVFVLSTTTADEMDILFLTETVMGLSPAEVVGKASAPGDDPGEHDRAWFFKLFALRGISEEMERMCFFGYLQKSD